jgi:hypothetical protein
LPSGATIFPRLAYSFTLKMEAGRYSIMSADLYHTTLRHVPESTSLRNRRPENLIPQKMVLLLIRSECGKDQEGMFAIAMIRYMQCLSSCRFGPSAGELVHCFIYIILSATAATACRSATIAAVTVKRETAKMPTEFLERGKREDIEELTKKIALYAREKVYRRRK